MERFPMIGCTSSGELTEAGYDEDSISLIGFPPTNSTWSATGSKIWPSSTQVRARGRARSGGAGGSGQRELAPQGRRAVDAAVNHRAVPRRWLSHSEELLAMTVQDALGEIPLVGGLRATGCASRRPGSSRTATFTLPLRQSILSTTRPLHVFRRQHYKPGKLKMVVTGAIRARAA
jgi:hypothetical protein